MHLIGMDIGGTKIEAVLFELSAKAKKGQLINQDNFLVPTETHGTLSAQVLQRKRISTDRHLGYDVVLDNMKNLILDICHDAQVNVSDLQGIGMGLPGTIDPVTQIMLNGNTGIFIGKDISKDLQKALRIEAKICCGNDARCFALAEVLCGAGQRYYEETNIDVSNQIGIGIILGTGVGGGIVVNRKILLGRNGGAGEIGHSELIHDGVQCYCGGRGCAEQYLSGPSIEGAFASRMYSQIEKLPSAHEIFEMAQNHESISLAVIKQYRRYLQIFITQLTNIFDPDYFVFGGGVSRQTMIYEGLEEYIKRESFIPQAKPRMYQHCLGDSAGVIGAALLTL